MDVLGIPLLLSVPLVTGVDPASGAEWGAEEEDRQHAEGVRGRLPKTCAVTPPPYARGARIR